MSRILLTGLVVLGCAGQDGEAGARGKAGESAVVEASDATKEQCLSGGTVLEIGVGDELDEVVLCNGEPGPQGERGPRGDAGAPAAEGLGRVVASLSCGAPLEGTTAWFAYSAVQFADGTLWVHGAIKGPVVQASSSALYAPEQNGAATGRVSVTFDAAEPANAGFWTLEVNRETLAVQVGYFDSDVAGGELHWELDSSTSNCVLNDY